VPFGPNHCLILLWMFLYSAKTVFKTIADKISCSRSLSLFASFAHVGYLWLRYQIEQAATSATIQNAQSFIYTRRYDSPYYETLGSPPAAADAAFALLLYRSAC
jgi:hypothetical protein